ncbi:murein hydrolase activator EnvC family protein [Marinobacter segnicrescens]|mgnify:CR=1 FL=1|uniref:Septal ring factor EnvC, activator of murein hydrolases AmiA and AmiB n=1 Tax=Marinobacter segnicrescens TaxID=430453 RepID=A0A1I0DTE6_9GAMM|nr:peptidoglycan DD-metalloendopeptidase family protein [Marinobacter segnicrescens]SET35886.1 Septal ring factor EnvC, activator of murein hydrolases AmiA and AmiB [Marinobacter segnicrescens]
MAANATARPVRGATGIVRLALFAFLLTGTAQAQEQVTPAQVKALKEEIEEINEWLSEAEEDRSELEQTLARTEKEISRLTRERRELQDRRRRQARELEALEQQEKDLDQNLQEQRSALKQQLRGAWMEGQAPAIKVLLNEANPQEIARTMTYYEYLSGDNLQRLETFNNTLAELETTRQRKLEAQAEVVRLEKEAGQRHQALQARKATREKTLASLEQDIAARQNQRSSLEADRERLEKLLKEVEEAIANIPSPTETEPFSKRRGGLAWPAEGRLVAAFGGSMAQGHLRRNGILVNTEEEAEIKAVHYGRVVFSNWLRGFGMMTIIDHGEGYMTLYGHSSSLLTSPGDWVRAGETIALAGRTGGTTDPAVYFELRHNGKPQNPTGWLKRR